MGKVASCCLLFVVLTLFSAPAADAANAIQAENSRPGDSDWTVATQDPVSADPPIAGFASANSVRPGGTIGFHITTSPAARYRIEISRLGWYGGSGGRRISCLVGSQLDPSCSADRPGVERPAAASPSPGTGEIREPWPTTDKLTAPAGWTTGYYLAVFRLTSGPSAGETGFVPFIVQAPVGDRAPILVQAPTNTWQAYNDWGGRSLYTTPPAIKVSFDRPYAHRLLFWYEYPLVRFLERGGFNLSYATDDGVDADPHILLHRSLDMSAGHDEYWTKRMRDGWEAARAAGINLAVMGADEGFWQVRYEDGRRTMVGYKYAHDPYPDPAQKTTAFQWLNPPRPPCSLFGLGYQQDVVTSQNLDLVATDAVARDPWFVGTGLSTGSVLAGLGGSETDAIVPRCHVPPVTRLLTYTGPRHIDGQSSVRQDTVRYTACSGAEVFDAGSLQFAWGLDPWRDPYYASGGPGRPPAPPPANAGLQRAMTRALHVLIRSHTRVHVAPRVCVPVARISVSVAHPVVGQRVTLTSRSRDKYGEISRQRWTISLGRTAVSASGPRISLVFRQTGIARVRLIVADSSGATARQVKTIRIDTRSASRSLH